MDKSFDINTDSLTKTTLTKLLKASNHDKIENSVEII